MDARIEEATIARQIWLTSFITWIEVLTLPRQEKNRQVEMAYRDWFRKTKWVRVLQSSSMIMDRTVHFRSEYGFKTPEAIQLASAEVFGADVVITNDLAWKKVKELRVVTLDEL